MSSFVKKKKKKKKLSHRYEAKIWHGPMQTVLSSKVLSPSMVILMFCFCCYLKIYIYYYNQSGLLANTVFAKNNLVDNIFVVAYFVTRKSTAETWD